jgi:cellulose synthase (UDP-forming)
MFCAEELRAAGWKWPISQINHALTKTSAEYVAVFDCDHVPTRAFLQLTLGWMLRDRGLCMVQTPHYFYSPDPFERNLASGDRVPNESLLFYGLIQMGNDFWGATFFCGSCAVIRRTALESVGGVPTETVTEDCHASLRMQMAGWRTAYLRVPLAAGLATERLMLHIGQRLRWLPVPPSSMPTASTPPIPWVYGRKRWAIRSSMRLFSMSKSAQRSRAPR